MSAVRAWPNALDFWVYNARHACRVKSRERLATLLSEVERAIFYWVKFGQAQSCRALSSVRMCSYRWKAEVLRIEAMHQWNVEFQVEWKVASVWPPSLDNTQQCSIFVEQCIVRSRDRLAKAELYKRILRSITRWHPIIGGIIRMEYKFFRNA